MAREAPDFSLPNLGPGPDPFTRGSLPERRALVLFFQRDHYCTNCREQVEAVARRVEEFRERDAEPVSVLPESVERAEQWQDRYGLPYPLLADPEAAVCAAYGQPVRFGWLGEFSDFLGRMPQVAVVDREVDPPEVADTYRGRSTFDRPDVDDVLAELDGLPGADES